MQRRDNIFLVGPMGSGKSAVGKQLARELELIFHDSDAEIEKRTGVDIPYIFEKEGEPGFRARERAMIAELTAKSGIVLATGGGAVVEAENRSRLTANGTVVYLRTTVAQQLERTRHTRQRPLLLEGDPRAVLTELMEIRAPLYEEIADVTVDTGGRRVGTVVADIRNALERLYGAALKR